MILIIDYITFQLMLSQSFVGMADTGYICHIICERGESY